MKKGIEEFSNSLNYENNYYFYHETSNSADAICERGLLLSGHNILGVNNLLYTTASPLDEKIATDPEELTQFISSELRLSKVRPVDEMVIIGIPKDDFDYIIEPNDGTSSYDADVAHFRVDPAYVIGYFDLESQDFIINPKSYYTSGFHI